MAIAGKIILLLLSVGAAIGTLLSDFDRRHIFNPEWPPHARFHAAGYAILNMGCSLFCIVLLLFFPWGRTVSTELVVCLQVLMGGSMLFALILPGTSSIAGGNDRVYAQAAVSIWMSVLFILLTFLGGWLALV